MYVKGELKFYDEFKRPIHKVKFDLESEREFKKLLNLIKLKD